MVDMRPIQAERMTPRNHVASWLAMAAAAALATCLAPAVARAQEEPPSNESKEREARGLFDLGSEAYADARYEGALKYFQEAYALSQKPGLLYNLGLTYSNLRRDREAIDAFERYLADVPSAQNREAVENRIALLKKNLQPAPPPPSATAAKPGTVVAPTPTETARAQMASTPPAPPEEPRSDASSGAVHTKWWFWAGIGGAVVAGVLIGVAASGTDRTVEGPALLDDMTRVREL